MRWGKWSRKWPDFSLQTKCLLLISFPAAATVLMFGVANLLAARGSAAGELVNRCLHIAGEIQRLRSAEFETSANARAYLISAQESFVSRTRLSLARFDSARQQLLNLTADSPVQQQRILQIAAIGHAHEERMFGDIARFRAGVLRWDQVRSGLREVETERLQMEDLLKLIEQDNTRQLEILSGRVDTLRAQQSGFSGVCLIFGLAGGLAMTLLFARGITNRLGQLRRNVAHLASGTIPEALTGLDEIGALNEGLIQVAEILRRKGVALENVLHGIAEVDADGRYVWLNKSYAEMAGFAGISTPPDIATTVQAEDRPRVREAIGQMRLNGRAEIAVRIDQPNGPVSDVGITFLAAAQEPGSSFYVLLHDLWAGKRGDAALIRAKDAAVASNRAKSEFLAKISHDIRTPLNAILGSADLLSQTSLSLDQGEYVSMFQRNCRRLVALINDFLDFSRIEAGAVRVEMVPFRVRDMVADAVATFREAAARKGILLGVEIDSAVPECALGDPLRIQQVLVNLLSNALKFTDAGRVDVNVKAMSAASAGDKLRFEVCDTGPGIRLEDQDKIFARFVQLPNQSNRQRGTGLGLTICRDLVELMGGEIGVISREARGSAFHFSLPLEAVTAALADAKSTVQPAPAQLPGSEAIRILVAEDTEDNRLLLEHYLRGQPVKLRIAANGQEAYDAIQRGEQFDLILMDIDMPVMDGFTATKKIRAWQQSKGMGTPIIALSADAMQEAVRASMDAGCVAHVAKPIDRETLLNTIRRYAPGAGVSSAFPPRTIPVSDQVMALVPEYLASKEKQIEEARAALASRDFGPIRRFGHNLKGTGRGYGFPPIEEMGRKIESAAAQADATRIADQLDALHQFVTESAVALHGS
ncbi:MAG: ATP-binding protein [Bryobacteraceae bacterium]|jgi:signal transduction histidine kinase/CheY-like chemotaxis protein/HPt (histidine-containing phosphotransfer) domain-containing protein